MRRLSRRLHLSQDLAHATGLWLGRAVHRRQAHGHRQRRPNGRRSRPRPRAWSRLCAPAPAAHTSPSLATESAPWDASASGSPYAARPLTGFRRSAPAPATRVVSLGYFAKLGRVAARGREGPVREPPLGYFAETSHAAIEREFSPKNDQLAALEPKLTTPTRLQNVQKIAIATRA
jgi:hypothetical protein